MNVALENMQKTHALDNMDTLSESVRERIGITNDVEKEDLIYEIIQASNDIKNLLKSSFGPHGMNKLIINPTDDIYLTSDGRTIIEQIDVLHPVVTLLKNLAVSMDKVCGDGTKTSVILASALIENSTKLLNYGLHPTTIIKGYQLALNKAYDILNYKSTKIVSENDIYSFIINSILSKGIELKQSQIIADIVLRTITHINSTHYDKNIDLNDYIKVIKKVGGPSIECLAGIVLDERPASDYKYDYLENVNILIINGNIQFESKIINSQHNIKIKDYFNSTILLEKQKTLLKSMAQKIIDSKANVVLCEGNVDESVEETLSKNNILLFQKLKKKDIEMVSKTTGANIVSIKDNIMPCDLGVAEELKINKKNGEHFLSLCVDKQPISTIIIWEPFRYGLEKIEEAVNNAINNAAFILKNPLVVKGGGNIEFILSQMLRSFSSTVEGKEQLAVIEYANALETIPRTLAYNAGLNEIDAISKMLYFYNKGIDSRIDIGRNVVDNNSHIYDSFVIKQMALIMATDTVNNMLRIDKILLKKS